MQRQCLSIIPQDGPWHLTSQAGSCRESVNGMKRDHAAMPQRGAAVVSSTALGLTRLEFEPLLRRMGCALCLPYRQMCTQSRWNPLEALEALQLSSGPSWAVGGHKFTMIYENNSLKNTPLFSPPNCLVVSAWQFCHAVHKGCSSQPSSPAAEESSGLISFATLAEILGSSFSVYRWGGGQRVFPLHLSTRCLREGSCYKVLKRFSIL